MLLQVNSHAVGIWGAHDPLSKSHKALDYYSGLISGIPVSRPTSFAAEFFTGSALPEAYVWIPFLIYRVLCLVSLATDRLTFLCSICSFHMLLLVIAHVSHLLPSTWKTSHVANSDSFLKSKPWFSWRVTLFNICYLFFKPTLVIASLWPPEILFLSQT